MHYIDWGLSLVKADVLAEKSADTAFDLAEIYSDLSRREQLAGYEVTTRFYEIGSMAGLRETDAHVNWRAVSRHKFASSAIYSG